MGNSYSAQHDFLVYIAKSAKDPPDLNAPLPLGNQHGVIYGVTIPFHVRDEDSGGCIALRGLTC
jgi:hypothetical protein